MTKDVAKDIAKNLLKLGLSIDDVAKSTELTVEDVRELQRSLIENEGVMELKN